MPRFAMVFLRKAAPAVFLPLLAVLHACSADGGEETRDAVDARDVIVADEVEIDLGDMDGGSCSGDGDCREGEYCNLAGYCISQGSCLVDGDCTEGAHCGAASHVCMGEVACRMDGDCDEGLICNEEGQCEDCGGAEFGTTRLAPNVLILLDRSGSMENTIGSDTRRDIAKEAVRTVTTGFDVDIRFGLATYSSCLPGGCSAGGIVVDIADSNASAINAFLDPLLGEGSPDGAQPRYLCDSGDPETTTGITLHALLGEAQLQDPARLNAVLLLSDGEESRSCGEPYGPEAARELFDQEVSVRTYAVGFSEDADMAQMNDVAAAGGTGEAYFADALEDLLAAFESIAVDVLRCDFLLSETPPEPDKIYVYFNDDPAGIEEDPDNGWTYDLETNTLHFHGDSCDMILSGEVEDIDVVYGCPGPVPF